MVVSEGRERGHINRQLSGSPRTGSTAYEQCGQRTRIGQEENAKKNSDATIK
jgi:hypothetical protein